MEKRCQCLTSKGNQCFNKPTIKKGANHKFCWIHQNCQKDISKILLIKKKSIKEKSLIKKPSKKKSLIKKPSKKKSLMEEPIKEKSTKEPIKEKSPKEPIKEKSPEKLPEVIREEYKGPDEFFDYLSFNMSNLPKSNEEMIEEGGEEYNFNEISYKGSPLTAELFQKPIFTNKTVNFVFPKLIKSKESTYGYFAGIYIPPNYTFNQNEFDDQTIIENTLEDLLKVIINWTIDMDEETDGQFSKMDILFEGIDQLTNAETGQISYTLYLDY
jgi:hypothetical protein